MSVSGVLARASVVLGTAAVVLVPAGSASAHGSLIRSEPADGSTVHRPPAAVRLVFAQAVQPRYAAVAVTGPDGARVDAGSPQVAGGSVTEPLRPLSVPGRYLVAYRVLSEDGHPVSRQLTFVFAPVGGAATTIRANTARSQRGPLTSSGPAEGHFLHIFGSALAIGAALVVILVERLRIRRRR